MSSLTYNVPHRRDITNITNSFPAVVTTSDDHGYFAGSFITIFIPYPNVMQQLNGKTYLIQVLSDTTFSIPVDTTNYSAFAASADVIVTPPVGPPFSVPAQQAQSIPSAEFGTTLRNASNVIGPNNPP